MSHELAAWYAKNFPMLGEQIFNQPRWWVAFVKLRSDAQREWDEFTAWRSFVERPAREPLERQVFAMLESMAGG